MEQSIKFIGVDLHKATLAVAVADGGGGEDRYLGEIANTPEAVAKLVRQLRKGATQLSFCYKAGPCGYGLQRQLSDLGWECQVVAPSLIPRKAGDRVKTDRRDIIMLARLHRAGELTAVWVPDEAQASPGNACRPSCCATGCPTLEKATGPWRTGAGSKNKGSRSCC